MKRIEAVRWPNTTEREATVQLSDTFSGGKTPYGAPPIADFDSLLTAQVRNSGHFADLQSPIGEWPDTGSYGAVLLSELRVEQRRLYDIYEKFDRTDLPDAMSLERSLGSVVVAVVNWAPRTDTHHKKEQNGEHFYLAELDDNIQILSQLRFLGGVATRGLVQALWRVPDDNPVWPTGEQFRSSVVSQIRNFPEGLVPEPLSALPKDERDHVYNAFGDKYGNVRLEVPVGVKIPEVIRGDSYNLTLDGKRLEEEVVGATRITDIGEDQIGLYANPADANKPNTPRYLELVRRVSDPNEPSNSAYSTLRRTVLPDSDQHPDWSKIDIKIAA
jgi:hypothetical protein